MADMQRRNFLRNASLGSAAFAAASIVNAGQVGSVCDIPTSWDEEFDVVVIGTGFAGLAAAIEAKRGGLSVTVLEKMPTPGGNSIINGGKMSATGCPQQKLHKIEDSVDQWIDDTLKAGSYMNDIEKVRFVGERMLSNYEWTVNDLKVEWQPEAISQDGGHAVPRSVTTKIGSGAGIVQQELAKLAELGVKPRMRCYVERLIRDPKTGEMLGVQIREGYRFPKATSGKVKTIRAKRAVVAAWGGFGADTAYRAQHDPRLKPELQTTNQPGATGELWREAAAIGVSLVQVDWIQCYPCNSPREKGMGIAWQFSQNAAAQFGVWVSSEGKRFINELANRKVRADAIFELQSKGLRAWAITNEAGCASLEQARPGYLKHAVELGVLDRYDSLEALAKGIGVDPKTLQASVDEVNETIRKGNDPYQGRYIDKEFKEMKQGPWFVAEMSPKVHHCMGGIKTTPEGQAIDVLTDKPIKGLWACGEASAGTHGAVRLGCNAILDCLVTGRTVGLALAGKKA